ncbi:MAG: flagellar hook protein FlgE [Acidobacteria bacterium]|nr:flagellar hook protein FlgE [Acidobacteriota bacterium]
MALTSFYTALTSINNNSTAINVIGDNLANMNTVGFKASKVNFSELLAGVQGTSETGNPISIGLGSTLSGLTRMNNQGTIVSTGNSTDAAINQNGFFVVSTDGGMGFTRAGKFEWDQDGGLVHSDGFRILGYMARNGTVNSSGALEPIEIQKGQIMPASSTTSLQILANLDSGAQVGETYGTTVHVYDSLGAAHPITLEFTKTAALTWDWQATIPAVDVGGGAADPPVGIGNGIMNFDSDANLIAPAANPTLNINGLDNGASNMALEFGLWDADGNGLFTSFDRESGVSTTRQNGNAASVLMGITIDSSGLIVGKSETGESATLAQLALADFPNVEGLQKYKGSTFIAFPSSGEPSIGVAGTGGRGTISGAALEQSNVDMAQEFVNLITAQRAYQANTRIITTTDELYQESINLKR